MERETPDADWRRIEQTLCDIRDTWVLVSVALKDHVADTPSPLRDEVATLVERQLARIRESERGNFD
jgi:hypothetical protein